MDWIGTITALAGAYLLSFDKTWSRWGWVLYLVSNVAWVAYGVHSDVWSLVIMQIGFMGATLNGIYRKFVAIEAAT